MILQIEKCSNKNQQIVQPSKKSNRDAIYLCVDTIRYLVTTTDRFSNSWRTKNRFIGIVFDGKICRIGKTNQTNTDENASHDLLKIHMTQYTLLMSFFRDTRLTDISYAEQVGHNLQIAWQLRPIDHHN